MTSEVEYPDVNNAVSDYPRYQSIQELFEKTVDRFPHLIAASSNGHSLTYDNLNRRANKLAHQLRELGVGTDAIVGCCCHRSLDLIIALVAIMKAGGAYLPLDPDYPAERISFMIDDAAPVAVVGTQQSLAKLPAHLDRPVLVVGQPGNDRSDDNPESLAGPMNTAYIMYTSGSTGRPKGVVAAQRGIVRLVKNTNFCTFEPEDVWLHFSPLAFDASTLEIWGPLLNGGRIAIAPPKASIHDLAELIRNERVTSLWLTSALFNQMVESKLSDLQNVRQLFTGGEAASPSHFRRARAALGDNLLINGYGPTENTTFTCCHIQRPGDVVEVEKSIPIGRPVANSTVYLLDETLKPVAPHATGELFTGGDGVAKGYLNLPQETADKFLPDPFSQEPGARMYRTGDLARWREDGTIEFIGRSDNQVKILGHRIEPGEIEIAIDNHQDVSDTCVIVQDIAISKRLIAYYVARNPALTPSDLRTYLTSKLPRYMIPALFVPMEQMPVNMNGKIDRSALPNPQFDNSEQQLQVSENSSIEDIIASVWQHVLQQSPINRDENFFDIGGDSLRLVDVHERLERLLKTEVPIVDLFEYNTVRTLAKHLGKDDEGDKSADTAKESRGARQRAAFATKRNRRKINTS